ncbi:MAG: YaeQ family protein [Betaproteobacteria bacterium]|nr:YaeQ family protein [Betaproteobacteria bacterium]
MALRATIFKANLQIADMDRHYYASHSLTLARHPSETDERLMVRLLAFALFADERLQFGRGLSSEDEAALWHLDRTGAIETWIEVGLPDERLLRRACGRARQVALLAYGGRAVKVWWDQNRDKLARLDNLAVWSLPATATAALAALAERSMDFVCSIQDGHLSWSGTEQTVEVTPERLKDRT